MMKTRKIKFLSVLAAVAVAVAGGACSEQAQQSTPQTEAAKGPTIRIGYSAWPGWFPWRLAEKRELFRKHGVNVELRWFDNYLDSLKALSAGQLDGNCQTLNDTISSVAGGSDQVIVLVNDNSVGNDKVIVSKEIRTIADLKGKRVAAEEGAVDHFLLLLGLREAGLDASSIDFQPLETGAAAAAFVAGKLDAVAVFAPFTTQALKREGSHELFSSKDYPGAIPDHLVVTRKLMDERPEAVQALVDTWFETRKVMSAEPDATLTLLAQRAGVSEEEYDEYGKGTRLFDISDNLHAYTPSNDMTSLHFAADRIGQFLKENNFIKDIPDAKKFLDDRFVKDYSSRTNGR